MDSRPWRVKKEPPWRVNNEQRILDDISLSVPLEGVLFFFFSKGIFTVDSIVTIVRFMFQDMYHAIPQPYTKKP